MSTFAENLYNLRKRRRMTQEQLAKYADVSCAAIWQYENGKATPRIEISIKLAQALGVTVEQLANGTENV